LLFFVITKILVLLMFCYYKSFIFVILFYNLISSTSVIYTPNKFGSFIVAADAELTQLPTPDA
jgi:hypothetical protein